MTPEERQQLKDLMKFKKNLESSNSIPLNIDQSFRDRFSFGALEESSKSSSSENQAVDEGGSATYNVLKSPDGFVETEVNGVIIFIPKYD